MITNNENIKQEEIKKYPDGSRWANCPWCGKKAMRLQPSTVIIDYLHKCQGSKCHKEFSVNVKSVSKFCRKEFIKQAEIKKYPDGSRWANCPWCGKKAMRLQPSTVIIDYLHKCQGSKCHKEFSVNVKSVSKFCRKEFLVDVKN